MSEGIARVGDIELCYETIGDPADRPLLLIMGLGMQLIHWDLRFCELLAERGFHVIRFDNRDAGRSTSIDARVPNVVGGYLRGRLDAPYLLSDMATDARGLLDELGVERAHVVGTSMGGMIAQTFAIQSPERIASLTSIMSNTGARGASFPKPRVLRTLLTRAPSDRTANVDHFVKVFRTIGSPAYPMPEARMREVAGRAYDRGHNPAGTGRQLAAIVASGDRTRGLRGLDVPALVLHGRADPLVPFRGGRATAKAIPGARLVAFDGMGHDLPEQLWPAYLDAIVQNAARVGERQHA